MRRLIALALVTLFLSGCGAKFAYNNLGLVSPWYVDDYIELDQRQQEIFDRRLQELHAWHRNTELVQYRELFAELYDHLQQDSLEPQILRKTANQLRGHWQALIQQATPAVEELGRTLNEQQREKLFVALEERNQKRLERADTPEEHREESLERIDKWMGPLTKQQREWVVQFAAENPDLSAQTVAAHRAFQAGLADVLADPSAPGFSVRLQQLLEDALGGSAAGRELNSLREQQLEGRVELFQRLWGSASENQKRKIRSRLLGYIEDIDDLISD